MEKGLRCGLELEHIASYDATEINKSSAQWPKRAAEHNAETGRIDVMRYRTLEFPQQILFSVGRTVIILTIHD